ncbi:imidazole glycerol phosphate synthase subunit HisH [Lentilactobacillus otakiensis]|mgnify:CR=1 FL=1|uniref:Imidazole glycerol phosphate synthase subunit HisH n=1 Tax=Lentilactobacillus otakiensis DSM 19908 = JCM 15040 TaxID=1423780 RepID=S4NTX7_9LACO|nr:imidazole glycerol phosphate synthase subunit HisH [Lentilactobacillus otakiensis]KRL08565.1 imidazole glycerol phosphate synthase subunit hisH [Lentilactobacillus otakiensis DSM 19908 = JCM 15040]MBZ3777652.1 imidazole glycerol phosphate synthase subunit HisH [Lentilactobacillus otakiensis]MDV3518669.1 imidazole glycerol phosphate synthase subunit HisH [Lentilactobacillus otakiensis]GAD17428.1 imidazole glycerol phosphate synthase subunit hisH [Lentilactobacillus otakiensis DSM 19908 = JCM 
MMIIIDYDTGNTRNVKNALDFLGVENRLSADPAEILNADGLILPGVGAFKKAMDSLNERGLVPVIKQAANAGIPMLGICLGMQILFDKSYEFGESTGLGLIAGEVVPIPDNLGVKVPHMGWNQNRSQQADPLADEFNNQFSYFVHSYYVKTAPENILSAVNYGIQIPSIVRKDNVIGFQFHPEKSGEVGLNGLSKFKEMVENADYSRN